MRSINVQNEDVWFVYDGDCPLCLMGATHFRIKQAVGNLHVLDARQAGNAHPLMQEINAHGLNLDQGMVLKMGGRLYQGADALHVMALIGTSTGWFNRLNAALFRSEKIARLCYPSMKAARNLALCIKGVPQIRNLENVP
jgi:predicted DCC family thiol-disulfide oxidoreductase YuxK